MGSMAQLRPISTAKRGVAESQQVIGRQAGARERGERRGRVAAHRAQAAHLFWPVGARVTKILSAKRCRAASDDVGARPRARARRGHTCEGVSAHSSTVNLCAETLSGFRGGPGRRPERAPSFTPFGRRFILV